MRNYSTSQGEKMSDVKARRRRRRGKRAVTRRVLDEHGNVIVKRFRRRETRIKIPGLTAKKVPQLMLSLLLGSYAGILYLKKEGTLATSNNSLLQSVSEFLDSIEPLVAVFVTGSIGIALSSFLAYALFSQGFKVKRWGKAFRQFVTIWIILLVASSIVSPLINEPNVVRQIPEDQFKPRDDEFDLSQLSSPFYDELLDSFLDLLGGIDPDLADQIIANITPADGLGLDPSQDIYLYRWQVSETWDPASNDFKKADETTTMPFTSFDSKFSSLAFSTDNLRKFTFDNAFLTIGTSYTQPLVSFWNSEYGATFGSTSSATTISSTSESTLESLTIVNDLNEQPIVTAKFSQAGASGAIRMDSYWKSEDKSGIAKGSATIGELSSLYAQVPTDRFPEKKRSVDAISKTWGQDSLPGGANYVWQDQQVGVEDAFTRQYNKFSQSISSSTSVYSATLIIHNFIQQAVLNGLNSGTISLDPVQGQGDFAGTSDKAHYFYQALEEGGSWGLKELLPGYINMLRSFGIPARLALGFAGGTIDTSSQKISLQLLNLHYWVEVLIPWRDDSNNLHWSWGIFNPIPIYSQLLAGNIAYGRNALSAGATIELEPLTGKDAGSGLEFKLQTMGEQLQVNVSANFEGIPAANQVLDLKFLNEDDYNSVQSGTIPADPASIGLDIGTIKLNSEGFAIFNASVDFNGNVTINGTSVTQVEAVNLNAALNPGLGQSANVYAIAAIFGFSFNFTAVAWVKNGTLTLRSTNLPEQSIPNFNQIGALASPLMNIELESTLFNAQGQNPGNEIANETVSLLLFSQADFQSLDLATISPSTIDSAKSYAEGIMQDPVNASRTTANDGTGNWTVVFPLSDPSYPVDDEIYVFMVYWEGSTVFSEAFPIYVTLKADMTNSAFFNQSVLTAGQIINNWVVNTTITTLALGANPAPIANTPVDILFVNKNDFDNDGVTTYNDLVTFLSTRTEGVDYYNLSITTSHSQVLTVGGRPTTDSNGFVSAQLNVNTSQIAAGFFYYVLAVSSIFELFKQIHNGTDSSPFQFGVQGAPSFSVPPIQTMQLSSATEQMIVTNYANSTFKLKRRI